MKSSASELGLTNKLKKEAWEEITKQVNAVGRANRSMQKVKDKWKNLHSTAKKEYHSYRWESKKTGGGPQPKPPSQPSKQIIELLEDTPGFSGLRGFETSENGGTGEYDKILLLHNKYRSCDNCQLCNLVPP